MINKRIASAIALGIAVSNMTPIIVSAQPNTDSNTEIVHISKRNDFVNRNILKKYPKVKILKQEDMKKANFSEEINKSLNDIIANLNTTINNKDLNSLKTVLKDVLAVHEKVEYDDLILHEENDQFDYIFFNSIALIFELTENNDKLRNETLTKLMDDLYVSSTRKFNTVRYGSFVGRYSQYMYKSLSEYIKDERTVQILLYGFSMINAVEEYVAPPAPPTDDGEVKPPTFPEDQLPSVIKPDVVPPPPEIPDEEEIPPIKPPVVPPETGGIIGDKPQNYEEFSYVNKGGVCYKVTKIFSHDGKLIRIYEEKLDSSMNGFCNIYDYEVIEQETWNNEHKSDVSLKIWNSLSQNDLNEISSNNTIQFTINKSEENPYYYDTGIRTSSKDTITFTQLTDALKQVLSKTESSLLEDKDKLLFICEGLTLVINNSKEEYTQKDVLNLLTKFKDVGLKIDERKSLDSSSIEDKLSNNELTSFKFDGKDIIFEKLPQFKDNILQLPISEIAKAIGYKVADNKDKLVITGTNKLDKEVKIEVMKNSNKLVLNGANKTTFTSSEVVDGTLFGEMNLILKEMGYTLVFDSDLGTIEIK